MLYRLILSAILAIFLVDSCHAWPRIFRRRRVSYSANYSAGYSSYASPAEAADAKARIQANSNSMFHPGGGFGGGYAEGVGAGMTPAAALGNCCFTGQRPLLASACYQGTNGMWYACKIFQ